MNSINLFLRVVVFVLYPSFLSAQDSNAIKSKLVDDKTNKAVPFATIRVVKDGQIVGGVISNGNGDFQIPSRYSSVMDFIEITCIGYSNLVLKRNQLSNDRVNIIKLKTASVQLQPVVISAHKRISPSKIIEFAIENIPKNYPTNPYSYVAYYRDYQKEENEYVNLNEAIIGVFDDGFNENDFSSTEIKLYQYKQNKEFKRDSMTALAYDNNILKNKFIPSATVSSFGGNELSILRIHDAIRNYKANSYSFVNIFSEDFLKNHFFKLEEPVNLDSIQLYRISFTSLFSVTGAEHFAKGEIFVEHGNYAVHKFIYSTYLKEGAQDKLLYNIQLEYARKDSLMYLNYISFNNFFKSKKDIFKVVDVALDRAENYFIVTFNHLPEKISALHKENYIFKLNNKVFKIDRIELSESNNKEAHVFFDKQDFNLSEKADVLAKKLQFNFKNIKDNKGDIINAEQYKPVSQFRELFFQKLNLTNQPSDGPFISKELPIRENEIDSTHLNASAYWMNTPLNDNTAEGADVFPQDIQTLNVKPIDPMPGQSTITALREKTYVQTDKPYYYPGEKLWFKAYMNYQTLQSRDSLSKVLYVELINAEGKIEQSHAIRIESSSAVGDFSLRPSLKPGSYFLRAYTNWMLNYGEENICIKPLQILNLFERPEKIVEDTARTLVTPRLILRTPKKKSFSPREEVKLEIELADEDGKPLGGNLSMSVTDLDQVKVLPSEKNILTDFNFGEYKETTIADSLLVPVEFGISYRGNYKNKKAKTLQTKLTVVQTRQKKLEDFVSIDTDKHGKFWVTGFQFYDSAKMGFKEANSKEMTGKIILQPREIPSTETLKTNLVFKTETNGTNQRPELSGQSTTNVIVLKEVVIEGHKFSARPSDPIYGTADYSVPGDIISSYNSIGVALQSRVPGLLIFGNQIKLGYSSINNNDPLLIIDDVRIGGVNDLSLSVGDALLGLNPNTIERIDIFKYGGAAIYGAWGASGVIIVHTKLGDYGVNRKKPKEIDLDSYKTFNVMGYSTPSKFKSPDYSGKEKASVADLRSTIFWQPAITIDEKTGKTALSFFTADSPARYRIVIEGITSTSKPVRNVMYIDVVQ